MDVACLGALGVLLAVFAYQGLVDSETGGLRAVQDHVITWSFSRRVAELHEYFRDFAYPLPAVVLKLWLGRLGPGASSVVWMGVLVASAFASMHAAVLLMGSMRIRHAYLPPLIAFAAVVYFVQWDFRAVNSNTAVLALALYALVFLVRGRPAPAGLLLAASIALKLYPLALIPGLLARGRWRALAWCAAGLVFFFAALPALYLGPADSWDLSRSWLSMLIGAGSADYVEGVIAYRASLQHVLENLFGARGGEGARAAGLGTAAAYLLTRALQLLWLAGLALWLSWERRQPRALGEGAAELINASLALGAVMLLSPLLQPHHGAFLLAPAFVLAHVALDARQGLPERRLAATALGLCALGMEIAPSGPMKGLGLLLVIALFSGVLVRVRVRAR